MMNDISTDYMFDFDSRLDDSAMPEALVPLLPDKKMITILGYGDSERKVGHRYKAGIEFEHTPGAFIQYQPETKGVFEKSYHPFIHRYTENVVLCAEKMMAYIKPDRPYCFELQRDQILMWLNLDGIGGFAETMHFVTCYTFYRDSYHDGGGSGGYYWCLYPADGIQNFKEEMLLHDRILNEIRLPDCKGYWIENDHLYLVDPWGIPGIFNFYHHRHVQEYYDSETENWIIGINCPEAFARWF